MGPNKKKASRQFKFVLRYPFRFLFHVIKNFRANQGFLLAAAVAYYTLLSIVPMFTLMLVGLSQVINKQTLLKTTDTYLNIVAPAQSQALTEQIAVFLDHWKVVGFVGFLVLLFFSSLAFTVLENAMSVIFYRRIAIKRRHFLISAIIPYIYIILLALGLFVVSVVSSTLQAVNNGSLLGHSWLINTNIAIVIYFLGVVGEILLLTSLYLVMPVGHIALRHALIGGVTAALLWEMSRHILAWYFSTLSYVNVIYGSFATVVVILLSLEIAAIILLLGAQVIADYEHYGEDQNDDDNPLIL